MHYTISGYRNYDINIITDLCSVSVDVVWIGNRINCTLIHKSMVLVRDGTISTERPPLVSQFSATFCG
jgi:hypothetical protein